VFAQNTAVIVEAESATLGSSLKTVSDSGSPTYVTVTTSTSGNSPSSAAIIGTASVTFPQAGTYLLYARVYVGESTFVDDSMFYGKGFGTKYPGSDYDWITVNGLANPAGYTAADDTIRLAGTATSGVWKWVRLSGFNGGEAIFTVNEGALTQTFCFAGREDGLRIDKFAFGPKGILFTVDQLDNNLPGVAAPAEFVPAGPEIATGKSRFLGNCYSESEDQNKHFSAYWNEVVPGNSGKWGWVERTRDTMSWTDLDNAYNFAKENGYPFCFHILVWGAQQPTWMRTLSSAEQLDEIKEWFAAVAERYPDIDYLQVVNEPLHQKPDNTNADSGNYMNALGGTGTTGHDWIIEAFRLAKQYFPNTPLMINEYGIVSSPTNTAQYVAIIKDLKKEGLIDLIGVQAHAFTTSQAPASTLTACLDSLAATGLDIMVTEMDIDGLDDNTQLNEYKRVFPVFWKHPYVMGISLWGYRVGLWRSETGAFIIDSDGNERPSMQWLQQYVETSKEWHGWPVTDNWANTGHWMGWVYSGGAPWIYAGKSWIWIADNTYNDAGCWSYILNSGTPGTATGENTWHGYPVTDGWANTGDWMGWVNITYAPKLWTDYGWVYLMEDTITESGAWAWLFR
jgi:endo-1,4-beta-xylanase